MKDNDNRTKEDIVEEMTKVVEQMKIDDLEERPELIDEYFDCSCCGQTKYYAGSIQYGEYRLCNDCVLLAEIGFALNKFKDINELIEAMEDKRLEEICNFIKQDELRHRN